MVLLSGGLLLLRQNNSPALQSATTSKHAAPPAAVSSKMLFLGDVFWGRSVQTKAEHSGKGYNYLMQGITAAERAAYDGWIANFECPITTRDVPYAQQIEFLRFNCRPEYLPALAQYFTAVTLANNHMDNNGGKQGLLETRQQLTKYGIQHFGSYDMSQTADLCEVVAMPAQVAGSSLKTNLPVALCGYMYVVDATPTDAQLAIMRDYAKVMPVIAMPHMGIEYRATAEAEKVTAYRRMIDNGADMVIGAHPHVIQNSESYKGKLIAYSLGNFLFDQQSVSRETTVGLGVGVTLSVSGVDAARYNKYAKDCSAYKDTCLQTLEAAGKRPTFSVSYAFTCFDERSGTPQAGSDQVCASAKQTATIDKLSDLQQQW